MTAEARPRLLFIDIARTWAIATAMMVHAGIALGGWDHLGEWKQIVNLMARTCTPLFFFLFGMMLELVYIGKLERGQGLAVRRTLLRRSAECYAAYLATAFAGFVGGRYDFEHFLSASVFLAQARFGNVLRFYAFAMFLAIPLLHARRRFGRRAPLVILGLIWLSYPVLLQFQQVDFGEVERLVGVLFGVIGRKTGSSVLYGMTFVLLGMVLSQGLRRDLERGRQGFGWSGISIVVGAILVNGWIVAQSSFPEFLANVAPLRGYKLDNHPGYFATGALTTVLILSLLARSIPSGRDLARWTEVPLSLGRSPLAAFTIGNVLLCLLDSPLQELDVSGWRVPLSLGFPVLLIPLVYAWERFQAMGFGPFWR